MYEHGTKLLGTKLTMLVLKFIISISRYTLFGSKILSQCQDLIVNSANQTDLVFIDINLIFDLIHLTFFSASFG
mgnify:FL=1